MTWEWGFLTSTKSYVSWRWIIQKIFMHSVFCAPSFVSFLNISSPYTISILVKKMWWDEKSFYQCLNNVSSVYRRPFSNSRTIVAFPILILNFIFWTLFSIFSISWNKRNCPNICPSRTIKSRILFTIEEIMLIRSGCQQKYVSQSNRISNRFRVVISIERIEAIVSYHQLGGSHWYSWQSERV